MKQVLVNRLKSRGHILISLVLATTILIGVSSIAAMIQSQAKSTALFFLETSFLSIEDKIRENLLNELAWRHTLAAVENNAALNCLRLPDPPAVPCRGSGAEVVQDLALYHPTFPAAVYYDEANPTHGFDRLGARCDTFDAASGNNACPFKVNFRLITSCLPGDHPLFPACAENSLNVEVDFIYKPSSHSGPAINASSRSFTINRSRSTELSPDTCRAMEGRYDTVAGVCQLTLLNFNCPAGQGVHRITAGVPECIPL